MPELSPGDPLWGRILEALGRCVLVCPAPVVDDVAEALAAAVGRDGANPCVPLLARGFFVRYVTGMGGWAGWVSPEGVSSVFLRREVQMFFWSDVDPQKWL